MHVYIEDIAKHEGQTVTIKGWLANRRSSGKIHFLQVRDGSGFIQAVMSKAAVGEETFTRADHLDLVGHYTLAGGSSGNWLPSGAGFTREAFDATWEAVAAAIAKGGHARR